VDVPGDAVEYEEVDVGLEEVGLDLGVDLCFPEPDGQFVGDEFSLAGVVDELLADLRAGVQGAEGVPAGEMEEAGDAAEGFPLGAFTAAGGTEE